MRPITQLVPSDRMNCLSHNSGRVICEGNSANTRGPRQEGRQNS